MLIDRLCIFFFGLTIQLSLFSSIIIPNHSDLV